MPRICRNHEVFGYEMEQLKIRMGKKLREVRELSEMDYATVSKKFQFGNSVVKNAERGRASFDTMFRLARCYGWSSVETFIEDLKFQDNRLCCEESEYEEHRPSAEADEHSNFGLM